MSLVRLNGKGYFVPADRKLPTSSNETTRLHLFSNDESERTHFVPLKKNKPPASGS